MRADPSAASARILSVTQLIPLIVVLCGMAAVMSAAWVIQLGTRNGGWVDVFWTFGTGVGGIIVALWPGAAASDARQVLVAVLVGVWSIRLGSYIAMRVAGDAHEDKRYAGFRTEWGGDFERNMYVLCIVQAPAAALLSLSIYAASHGGAAELGIRDMLGAFVLVAGIIGEGVADDQMRRFRKTASHGSVMDKGLWSWSRHPNYFFEWMVWLAYPVIVFDISVPWTWLSLVGPVMMFVLLRYGTGVPTLEKTMLASRGDKFRDYQKRVSAFFPLPPKRRPA
jgi:steroid 5-alpha reductase family enzyme